MENIVLQIQGKETKLYIEGTEIKDVRLLKIEKDGGEPTVISLEAVVRNEIRVECE